MGSKNIMIIFKTDVTRCHAELKSLSRGPTKQVYYGGPQLPKKNIRFFYKFLL